MSKISYAGYRFPPVIIQQAVWLYARFTLSFRDVEDLLAERGIMVSYETVRRWVRYFGPTIAADLRRRRPKPHSTWHLDEVFIRIDGRLVYLWRAVDAEGEVLDVVVQSKRDKRAALKLLRKLLKKMAFVPDKLVTDDLDPTARPPVSLGCLVAMNAGDGAITERELASTDPTTGAQDAGVQECGISPTISVRPRRHLQHLQRPASPHLSEDTPVIPSLGHADVARGDCCGVIGIECWMCRTYHPLT